MEHAIEDGAAGEPQDVTIVLSGAATPNGFRRLVRELDADPRVQPGIVILVDMSALDMAALAEEGLRDVSEVLAERDWRTPALAVAILAPDERAFRDASFHRAHLGGSRSRRRVFRSRQEALAWMREQRDAAGSGPP